MFCLRDGDPPNKMRLNAIRNESTLLLYSTSNSARPHQHEAHNISSPHPFLDRWYFLPLVKLVVLRDAKKIG